MTVDDGRTHVPQELVDAVTAAYVAIYLDVVRDWTDRRSDAWLHGIIVGWDDQTLARLAERYTWDEEAVRRLKAMRAAVADAIGRA